jgi:hypothetical protein
MASILKVDSMQGVTSAGDITITSEGGAATQSLQQGLVKHRCNFDTDSSTSVLGSFNNSSLTDNGTGDTSFTLTNNMNNATYSAFAQSGDKESADTGLVAMQVYDNLTPRTSSLYRVHQGYVTSINNFIALDRDYNDAAVLGDLA